MGLPVPVIPGYSCDDVQLGREITLLSAQINVANYRLLKLIAEFDLRGAGHCGDAMRSCAHWLAAPCGMAIGGARERVRVARRLVELPEVQQAFSTGELSYSKVRAITRVATQANEGFLVMMAEKVSASHLEKLVGKYRPVDEMGPGGVGLDGSAASGASGSTASDAVAGATGAAVSGVVGAAADGVAAGNTSGTAAVSTSGAASGGAVSNGRDAAADSSNGAGAGNAAADVMQGGAPGATVPPVDEDAQREQAREMYWFQDKEGMWIIHAKLPPEQGQMVMKVLEAVARPIQEERLDDWKEQQKAQMQEVARHIARQHREARVEVQSEQSEQSEQSGQDKLSEHNESYGRNVQGGTSGQSGQSVQNRLIGLGQQCEPSRHSEQSKQSNERKARERNEKLDANTAASVQFERAREKISAESAPGKAWKRGKLCKG